MVPVCRLSLFIKFDIPNAILSMGSLDSNKYSILKATASKCTYIPVGPRIQARAMAAWRSTRPKYKYSAISLQRWMCITN